MVGSGNEEVSLGEQNAHLAAAHEIIKSLDSSSLLFRLTPTERIDYEFIQYKIQRDKDNEEDRSRFEYLSAKALGLKE